MELNTALEAVPTGISPCTGLAQPVGVAASGMFVPEERVDNDYWEQRVETTHEWIVEKTGIHRRRRIAPDSAMSDMAVEAALEALERGGTTPDEVDAIVLNTFTPDYQLPSTALIVKEKLGAHRAMPLDLGQVACTGVVYGVHVGAHLLQNRDTRCVLVIGGEAMSRIINPGDRTSAVFFGDGAGALLLRRTNDRELGVLSWHTDAELSMDVAIPHGGSARPVTHASLDAGRQYFAMNGRSVWESATRRLPESVRTSLARARAEVDDVDLFLLHQANANIVREVLHSLGVCEERTQCNISEYGNTCGATLPTVFHEAATANRMARGDLVSMAGVGAGFLWGSMLLRVSDDRGDYQ